METIYTTANINKAQKAVEIERQEEIAGANDTPFYLSAIDSGIAQTFASSDIIAVSSGQTGTEPAAAARPANRFRRNIADLNDDVFAARLAGLTGNHEILTQVISLYDQNIEKIGQRLLDKKELGDLTGPLRKALVRISSNRNARHEAENYLRNLTQYLELIGETGGRGEPPVLNSPPPPPSDEPITINSTEGPDAGEGTNGTSGAGRSDGQKGGADGIENIGNYENDMWNDALNFDESDMMDKDGNGYYSLSEEMEAFYSWLMARMNVLISLLIAITMMGDARRVAEEAFTGIPLEEEKNSAKKTVQRKIASLVKMVQQIMSFVMQKIAAENQKIYNKRVEKIKDKTKDKGKEAYKIAKETRKYYTAMQKTMAVLIKFIIKLIQELTKSLGADEEMDAATVAMISSLSKFLNKAKEVQKKLDKAIEKINDVIDEIEAAMDKDEGDSLFDDIGDVFGKVFEGFKKLFQGDFKDAGKAFGEMFNELGDMMSYQHLFINTLIQLNDWVDAAGKWLIKNGWATLGLGYVLGGALEVVEWLLDVTTEIYKAPLYIFQGMMLLLDKINHEAAVKLAAQIAKANAFFERNEFLRIIPGAAWPVEWANMPFLGLQDRIDYISIDFTALIDEYKSDITMAQNIYRSVLALKLSGHDMRNIVMEQFTGRRGVESDAELLIRSAENSLSGITTAVDSVLNNQMMEVGLYNSMVQNLEMYEAQGRAAALQGVANLMKIGAGVLAAIGLVGTIFTVGALTPALIGILALCSAICTAASQLVQIAATAEAANVDKFNAVSPHVQSGSSEEGMGSSTISAFAAIDNADKANAAAAAYANGMIYETSDGVSYFNSAAFSVYELRQKALDNALRMIFELMKNSRALRNLALAEYSQVSVPDSGASLLSNAIESILLDRQIMLSAVKYQLMQVVQAKNINHQRDMQFDVASQKFWVMMGGMVVGAALGALLPGASWVIGMGIMSTAANSGFDWYNSKWGEGSAFDAKYKPSTGALENALRGMGGESTEARLDQAELQAYNNLLNNGLVGTGGGYMGVNFGLVAQIYGRISQIYTAKDILARARSMSSELRAIVKQEFSGISLGTSGSLTQAVNSASFRTAMSVVNDITSHLQNCATVSNLRQDAREAHKYAAWSFGINATVGLTGGFVLPGFFSGIGNAPGLMGGATASAASKISQLSTSITMNMSSGLIDTIQSYNKYNTDLGHYNGYSAKATVDETGKRARDGRSIDEKLDAQEYEILCAMNAGLIETAAGSTIQVSPLANILTARLQGLYAVKEAIASARSLAAEARNIVKQIFTGKGMMTSDFGLDLVEKQLQASTEILNSLQQALNVIVERENQIEQAKKNLIMASVSMAISAAGSGVQAASVDLQLEAAHLQMGASTAESGNSPDNNSAIETLELTSSSLNLAQAYVQTIMDQAYESKDIRNVLGAKEKKAKEPKAGAAFTPQANKEGGYFGSIANMEASIAYSSFQSEVAQSNMQRIDMLKELQERAVKQAVEVMISSVNFSKSTINSLDKKATYALQGDLLSGEKSISDLSGKEKNRLFFPGMDQQEVNDYLARLSAVNPEIAGRLAKALDLSSPEPQSSAPATTPTAGDLLLCQYAENIVARAELQKSQTIAAKSLQKLNEQSGSVAEQEQLTGLVAGLGELNTLMEKAMMVSDANRVKDAKVLNDETAKISEDKSVGLVTKLENGGEDIAKLSAEQLQERYNKMYKEVFKPLSRELQEQKAEVNRLQAELKRPGLTEEEQNDLKTKLGEAQTRVAALQGKIKNYNRDIGRLNIKFRESTGRDLALCSESEEPADLLSMAPDKAVALLKKKPAAEVKAILEGLRQSDPAGAERLNEAIWSFDRALWEQVNERITAEPEEAPTVQIQPDVQPAVIPAAAQAVLAEVNEPTDEEDELEEEPVANAGEGQTSPAATPAGGIIKSFSGYTTWQAALKREDVYQ